MHNARDLIRLKGGRVFSVKPDASVLDALKLMADKNIGAVMVMTGLGHADSGFCTHCQPNRRM